jgi:hypothetical protein
MLLLNTFPSFTASPIAINLMGFCLPLGPFSEIPAKVAEER